MQDYVFIKIACISNLLISEITSTSNFCSFPEIRFFPLMAKLRYRTLFSQYSERSEREMHSIYSSCIVSNWNDTFRVLCPFFSCAFAWDVDCFSEIRVAKLGSSLYFLTFTVVYKTCPAFLKSCIKYTWCIVWRMSIRFPCTLHNYVILNCMGYRSHQLVINIIFSSSKVRPL